MNLVVTPFPTPAQDWTLWQLADSAFPAGGFAHSGGLEAAWKAGFLPDEAALRAALHAGVAQAAAGALPLIHAVAARPRRYAAADARADASLLNHVANRASRAQGRALAAAAPRIFPAAAAEIFDPDLPQHLAPVYGRVVAALGLDPDAAARLFLFNTLRGALSAAVRLGVTGPLRAQTLLHEWSEPARAAADRAGRTLDDVYQCAPLLELLQGQQDRLYSRLFQS